MSALDIIPATYRLVAIGLLALAAVGAVGAWHLHAVSAAREAGAEAGRNEIRLKWDDERVRLHAAAVAEATKNAQESQRREAAAKEITRESQRLEEARIARAAGDAAAGDRLLAAARAARAASCRAPAGDPGAAVVSAPGSGAPDLLADLLGEVERTGRAMADEAQRRGNVGAECERRYDSLTQ